MPEVLTREAREELREALSRLAGPVLDEAAPEDPAEVELIALDMIGPLGDPGLPEEVVAVLPEVLEARRDEPGAGVLAALAALGPPPLAGLAAEARDRLARDGIVSPLEGSIGAVRGGECCRLELEDGEAEAVGAIVQREGEPSAQAAILIIDHAPCGGVVIDGVVTAPEDAEKARGRFAELVGGDDSPESIPAETLIRSVTDALAHMVDHEVELESEPALTLAILERALTGRTGAWPRPMLAEPDDLHDADPGGHLRRAAEDLIDVFESHLEAHTPDDAALREHAPVVASLMTEWKLDQGEAEFTRWTHDDVRAFLLDWYPRRGYYGHGTVALVPGSVIAFLRFLDERSLLSGAEVEALAATVERIRDRFEQATGATAGGPTTRRPKRERRAKRKASRSARKRNRR